MRIGIDASFLRKPGTGIGQVTFYFLETLKKLPAAREVEFFVYTEEPFAEEEYGTNFHFRSFLPWWKRDDLFRKLLWEKQVAKEAKKDGCSVFLSLAQSSTVAPSGMRHIMVVHDLVPRLFPEYLGNLRKRWYWSQVEQGILRADKLVAVSQATRNDLVEFGVLTEKIMVASPDVAPRFRQTLEPETENRVMAQYSLVPGYLYHGGGLEIRKNTETLLRAYKMLVDKEKHGELHGVTLPPLVISGKVFPESNPLATPVKKIIQELALGERVRLLDFIPEEDLPALYKNALFFLYPSRYEGFGLPVLEALCLGTPVLTAENSSLPEVAGAAALYIDSENIESLVSGIERLLSDAALRQSLSTEAGKQAQRFHWGQFTETVFRLLMKQ